MRWDHDGRTVVRADLCDRLNRVQQTVKGMTARDLMQRNGAIRTIASAYGLVPVVALTDALERAVNAEPRGCPARLYLERLRGAVGCERVDSGASEAMLASVSVRMAG